MTRALEKMRVFLVRRGLKIVGVAILPAALSESTRAADPALVAGIVQSVAAATAATPATLAFVLAKKAVAILAWKKRLLLTAKLTALFLAVSTAVAWSAVNRKPNIPAAAAIPPPAPQIASLAEQWSRVVRDVAALIQMPPPAPNTQAAARYNADYSQVIADTTRIANAFNAFLTPANERVASAEFLALELKNNLNLNTRQQAFAYRVILNALETAPSLKEGLNQLYRNHAAHAPQLRAILSLRQQWLFDSTYRNDGIGLFAFAPTLATGR